MDLIPYDDFPKDQQKIIKIKTDKPDITYVEWIQKAEEDYEVTFTPVTLSRFMLKTALGHHWHEFSLGGRNPYLNPTDKHQLSQEIMEECNLGSKYFEFHKFLEISIEIKIDRMIKATKFKIR